MIEWVKDQGSRWNIWPSDLTSEKTRQLAHFDDLGIYYDNEAGGWQLVWEKLHSSGKSTGDIIYEVKSRLHFLHYNQGWPLVTQNLTKNPKGQRAATVSEHTGTHVLYVLVGSEPF